MVVSDSGRRDKRHLAALQQGRIAMCACPDNQGVGIPHIFGADVFSRPVNDLVCDLRYGFPDKRDFIVHHYFHVAKLMSFYQRFIADSKKFV